MILGAVGVPGTGKSSKLIELLCVALTDATLPETTFRILDYTGDFRRYAAGHVYRNVTDYCRARTRMQGLPRVAVFTGAAENDWPALTAEVAQLVCDEGGVLVLDEVRVLVPPKREIPEQVASVCNTGRHGAQRGLWWAAQYAADVHDRLRRPTRMLYVFRQSDENDVDWVRRNTGPWGRQMRDLAPTLKSGEYVAVPRHGDYGPAPVVQHLAA